MDTTPLCLCTHKAVYLPTAMPMYSVTVHMCTTCIHHCNYVPLHVCTHESAHLNYASLYVNTCAHVKPCTCTYTTTCVPPNLPPLQAFLQVLLWEVQGDFLSEADAANWSPH